VKRRPTIFDVITAFDAVHDQARPLNVLKRIDRALKPDGVYLMQDIRRSSQVRNNIGIRSARSFTPARRCTA